MDKNANMGSLHHYNSDYKDMLKIWSMSNVTPPNLFFEIPQYGGVKHAELAEIFAKARYESLGIRRSFRKCYMLLKYPCDGTERELNEFFDSARNVAYHHEKFIGTFCIDISGCIDMIETTAFKKLVNYVTSMQGNDVAFVFIVRANDTTDATRLYHSLKIHIRINRMHIGYADTDTYMNYAVELLNGYDILVGEDALQILSECIDALSQKTYFSGYDSVDRLVEDVVFASHSADRKKLTKERLATLRDKLESEDLEVNSNRKIGFSL